MCVPLIHQPLQYPVEAQTNRLQALMGAGLLGSRVALPFQYENYAVNRLLVRERGLQDLNEISEWSP